MADLCFVAPPSGRGAATATTSAAAAVTASTVARAAADEEREGEESDVHHQFDPDRLTALVALVSPAARAAANRAFDAVVVVERAGDGVESAALPSAAAASGARGPPGGGVRVSTLHRILNGLQLRRPVLLGLARASSVSGGLARNALFLAHLLGHAVAGVPPDTRVPARDARRHFLHALVIRAAAMLADQRGGCPSSVAGAATTLGAWFCRKMSQHVADDAGLVLRQCVGATGW